MPWCRRQVLPVRRSVRPRAVMNSMGTSDRDRMYRASCHQRRLRVFPGVRQRLLRGKTGPLFARPFSSDLPFRRKARMVRIRTVTANTLTLGTTATVRMMSAATTTGRPEWARFTKRRISSGERFAHLSAVIKPFGDDVRGRLFSLSFGDERARVARVGGRPGSAPSSPR
jgi:hypothetical protein